MEIKEIREQINMLSREFLKIEKQQDRDQNYIIKQQNEIIDGQNKFYRNLEKLEYKFKAVESFENKIKSVNLINKFCIGVICALVLCLGTVTWKLNSIENSIIEKDNQISRILLKESKFWFNSKNHSLYLKDIKKG